MRSPTNSPVEGFSLMKFKQDALDAQGLPCVDYPIPSSGLDNVLEGGGVISPPMLLAWMQEYVSDKKAPWRDYRDAMLQLLDLCAPDDERTPIDVSGDTWSLVCGQVDLDAKLVSFSRDGEVLAVAEKNEDGRILVESFQPLDGRTLCSLINTSHLPAPDGTVCMRPDNWEYLGDNACGASQLYAATDGLSYRSLWEYGLGITAKQEPDPHWHQQRNFKPLPASMLATSQGLYYELSTEDTGIRNYRLPMSFGFHLSLPDYG